jgi:hypothetical protein
LVILGRKYGIDHFRDQIEKHRLLARKVLWNKLLYSVITACRLK